MCLSRTGTCRGTSTGRSACIRRTQGRSLGSAPTCRAPSLQSDGKREREYPFFSISCANSLPDGNLSKSWTGTRWQNGKVGWTSLKPPGQPAYLIDSTVWVATLQPPLVNVDLRIAQLCKPAADHVLRNCARDTPSTSGDLKSVQCKSYPPLRTCASESQHQPFGPLSRKLEQSFHVEYPMACERGAVSNISLCCQTTAYRTGVFPRPLFSAAAEPARARAVAARAISNLALIVAVKRQQYRSEKGFPHSILEKALIYVSVTMNADVLLVAVKLDC